MNTKTSKSDLQVRLARRLLQLIADGEMKPGDHLREVELSEKFAVSRTPIRGTLAFLEGLGALEKVANKGFFVRANGSVALKTINKLPQEDDEKIKDQIRKDWFDGNFPREVSEGEIRGRYDLGKMTASRVLAALAEEGIISRMPGYGWQFEPTLNTVAAHDESYDFRMIIEPEGILSNGFSLDATKASNLRKRHEQVLKNKQKPPLAEIIRLDEEFHEFIATCSRNRFVAQAVAHQNRLRRLMEYHSLIDAGRLTGSCLEHIEILDHLEAGENQKAAEAMRLHLRKAKEAAPEFEKDD
ncbi:MULTISPECIES: GntR family transcriptional regulator [unclassified Sulfitobacter]|jgi:DNA-binding GntR family transcriptional regulator|uniref:GntR family transcriptional regulator n=1 Tax=unclassified Sulfitobacter TaxID=196795 RepID=UPI002729C3B1|nr:GntR family transcriptional regulator [Sulfitobacter sp.]